MRPSIRTERNRRRWRHAVFGLVAPVLASATVAQEPKPTDAAPSVVKLDRFYVQTSLHTEHFHRDPKHNQVQALLDVEWHRSDGTIWGASVFRNSFKQWSEYVYYGRLWRPFDAYPLVHIKLTGGILHGYRGEFRDKVPFNSSGFAPVLLPSIGLSGKRFATELIFFGTNGAMWTAGVFIDP